MFSTSASASEVRSSASRTSAGIVGMPGRLRGAPAALARDQLPAGADAAHEHGLDDAVLAHALDELGEALLVDARARLARVRRDLIDGNLAQRAVRARLRLAEQEREALAEPASGRCAIHVRRPPGQGGSRRPRCASWGRTA